MEKLIIISGAKIKSLKGTQTEKNILTAFAGESQARNRYTYFELWRRQLLNLK